MRRYGILIAFLSAMCCVGSSSRGATLVVDLEGGADYVDIQAAIVAASDGDTVLVKPGEYVIVEPIAFNGKAITVRSEAGAESTTLRMSETPWDPSMASVVVFETEDSTSVLEGLTLTGGQGSITWEESVTVGGGIYCGSGSSPTLTNCTISGNSANSGGGVYCANSSPTVAGCTVSGNSTTADGGGIYCGSGSSPTLTNCTFSRNSANSGGGVFCAGSSPTLTNCTISGNSSANSGGGVCCPDSSPTLAGCTISGNSTTGEGGGIWCGRVSSPTLTNCTISRNSAVVRRCYVWGGCFGGLGGGMCCAQGSVPTLRNCTISGNSAVYGGGVCGSDGLPTLTNCIVWDNSGGSLWVRTDAQPNVSFSCLQTESVWPGEGNTNADPRFCGWGDMDEVWVDPSKPGPGDGSQRNPFSDPRGATTYSFGLAAGSPCLGTGKDGADMGADHGRCGGPGGAARTVHLAGGTYGAEDLDLAHRVTLQGAGEASTIIEGTVFGLRTGAALSDLTVTKGAMAGIVVGSGESPGITNCTISGNLGTGVHCYSGSPRLTDCSISGNSGGGLYCGTDSAATLTNCTISGNSTASSGGGLYCDGSSPTLTNCTISGNSTASSGGGVYCDGSSPTLTNCTISGNSAVDGGGVWCGGDSPTLESCTISGNSASQYGGGVFCSWGTPTFTSCTMSGNSTVGQSPRGGGVYCGGGSPNLTNCIVWDNAGGSFLADDGSQPNVVSSCLATESVWPGVGNTNADPLFCGWGDRGEVWVDPSKPGPGDGSQGSPFSDAQDATTGYSLALSAGSPCLGTGKDGADMGANLGRCGGPGGAARTVHLAGGAYAAEDLDLAHRVTLQGAGEASTIIEGTVFGPRTGAALSNVTVTKGTAGGIVSWAGEHPQIADCTISGNLGTGVHCYSGSPTLTNCTISGNSGGGVSCSQSSPTLTNCTISGNSGSGVSCSQSSPTLTNCTISGNSGSGVSFSQSSPTLTNCIISGNSSADSGGGVYCGGGSPTLENCTISGNSARQYGGGVCSWGTPIFTSCTISGNSTVDRFSRGGGVYCGSGSSPTLTSCTISGNRGGWSGGGVYSDEGSYPTLTNCTISGNSAESSGGGVYCSGDFPILTNCTMSGNSARAGGGVYCEGGSPTLTNCTISGNSAVAAGGVFCWVSTPKLTNCIVWANTPESACGILSHCLTDRDPLFVEHGRWVDCGSPDDPLCIPYRWTPGTGAPTAWHRWQFDYHVRPGSPAIDAGTSEGAPTTDIDGHGRPCGAGVDIGAYESGDCAAPTERFRRGDADASGAVNLTDPIVLLNHLFLGGDPPRCLDAADADDAGGLNITDAVYTLNFLFLGGTEPLPPFPGCGIDPTIDALGCEDPGDCG